MRKEFAVSSALRAAAFGLLALAVPGLAGCQTLGLEEGEKTLANMPANLAVDPFLWQGALETLYFLPIEVQDPSGLAFTETPRFWLGALVGLGYRILQGPR